MDFTTRLDILKNAGMLTEQDHGRICQVIDYFATEQGIGLTEENASSMITHLCAALGRIQRGEPVEPLDEEVYESTKEEPDFERAYGHRQEIHNILLCCDGAAWHKSASLELPENIVLFHIPPYTPEMNPIEQIRKRGFHNEVFATLDRVVDRLCDTICSLSNQVISSITGRDWIIKAFN